MESSLGGWEPPAERAALYFEAEEAIVSAGFSIAEDGPASNGRYLAAPQGVRSDDAPGEARAIYRFVVPRAGDYVMWGRIRAPGPANNRLWFQVDGGVWTKWRISVGDIWYWDDFHDDFDYGRPVTFSLRAGEHELALANCTDGVALDRLYLTADGDVPAGNDSACEPPHSIEVGGSCLPSCGSRNGAACGELECAGRTVIFAYDCDVCCL
jgi:hypothetical protein